MTDKKPTRYITYEQRTMALGLFMLAKISQEKVDSYEREMNELLGLDNGSHFSDEIYGYDWTLPVVDQHFEAAMKREKLKVLPPDTAEDRQ